MRTAYSATLDGLIQHRGVVGCMVVAEADGIVVDAHLHFGVPEQALAAVAAALYRRARLAVKGGGLGGTRFVRLDAEKGHLCVAGHGELVLIALTDARANMGLIRAAMLRAAETLK
jgi:predicted regulator of Ras-like GTPase activity (Roadblock/LC7/MglB family)